MIMRDIIKNNNLEELFSNVVIGLEKEGQRVLPNGQISKTDHPTLKTINSYVFCIITVVINNDSRKK